MVGKATICFLAMAPILEMVFSAGMIELVGGSGADRLYGDGDPSFGFLASVTRGVDRFVFTSGCGLDFILDFQNNKDVIDVKGFAGIVNFDDIDDHSSQVGTYVVIDFRAAAGGASNQDVLTLADFSLANLNSADFDFA